MKKNKKIYNICHLFLLLFLIVYLSCASDFDILSPSSSAVDKLETSSCYIDSGTGGTVSLSSGLALVNIPGDSIFQSCEVSVSQMNNIPKVASDDYIMLSNAIEFEPGGLGYDPLNPARISIKIDKNQLNGNEGNISEYINIAYYDPIQEDYVVIPSDYDSLSGYVSADIFHFSVYIAVAFGLSFEANGNLKVGPKVGKAHVKPDRMTYTDVWFEFKALAHRTDDTDTEPDLVNAMANVEAIINVDPVPAGYSGLYILSSDSELDTTIPDDQKLKRYRTHNDFYYFKLPFQVTDPTTKVKISVIAEDNLGFTTGPIVSEFNCWYEPYEVWVDPERIELTGGFQEKLRTKMSAMLHSSCSAGSTDDALVTRWIDADSWLIDPPDYCDLTLDTSLHGDYKRWILTAKTPGVSYATPLFGRGSTVASIPSDRIHKGVVHVYPGEIKSIEIVDRFGDKIDYPVIIRQPGDLVSFDALGYDEYGNSNVIFPGWASYKVGEVIYGENMYGEKGVTDIVLDTKGVNAGTKGYLCIGLAGKEDCIEVIVGDKQELYFNHTGTGLQDLASQVIEEQGINAVSTECGNIFTINTRKSCYCTDGSSQSSNNRYAGVFIDGNVRSWTPTGSSNLSTTDMGLASYCINNSCYIYSVGGLNNSLNGVSDVYKNEATDNILHDWQSQLGFPVTILNPYVKVYNGYLYVIGGIKNHFVDSADDINTGIYRIKIDGNGNLIAASNSEYTIENGWERIADLPSEIEQYISFNNENKFIGGIWSDQISFSDNGVIILQDTQTEFSKIYTCKIHDNNKISLWEILYMDFYDKSKVMKIINLKALSSYRYLAIGITDINLVNIQRPEKEGQGNYMRDYLGYMIGNWVPDGRILWQELKSIGLENIIASKFTGLSDTAECEDYNFGFSSVVINNNYMYLFGHPLYPCYSGSDNDLSFNILSIYSKLP